MKFLLDRCAGRRLAEWLQQNGHDVLECRTLGDDPGDEAILQLAADQDRILVTIDTDFGSLVFVAQAPHCGVVRLPDVPFHRRIQLMEQVLQRHEKDLEQKAIVTVRGGRIRISKPPPVA